MEEIDDPFEIITIVVHPDGSIDVEPGGMTNADVVYTLWKSLCLLGNPGFVERDEVETTYPDDEDED